MIKQRTRESEKILLVNVKNAGRPTLKVTQSPPGVFLLTDGGEGEAPVLVVKSVGGGLGTGAVSPSDIVIMEDGRDSITGGGGGVGTTPVYYT